MKKFAFACALFTGALASTSANATISLDEMLKFAENGEASFIVTNAAEYKQFIQVGIASIKTEKGEIVKTPYTRANISDWRLTAKPSRAVVNPKFARKFSVFFNAKNSAETEVDQTFQVTIVPTPYLSGKEKNQHSMQIAVGFAPYVIVPAKNDQPLSFDISRNKNKLVLKNKGKTYIRAFIDACPVNTKKEELDNCMMTVNAISGRHLHVDLDEIYQKAKNIKVRISTHKAKYKEEFVLANGQNRRV